MITFVVVGEAVKNVGWRQAWAGVGAAILISLVPIGWLLVRRNPESVGLAIEGETPDERMREIYDARRTASTINLPHTLIRRLAHSLFQFTPAFDQRIYGRGNQPTTLIADVVSGPKDRPVVAAGTKHGFGRDIMEP
jgi:hypothetical protein